MDLFQRRARSFGAHASDYAEHRANYPTDGLRWALAAATHQVHDVLDLAAGTGKIAEGLLPLGFEVTAVEPDDGMLAELSRRFPQVNALGGTAEDIPLDSASVDAVLVGQAFHWFDKEKALDEIGRVLRPGGAVGLLWNGEDESVEWVAGLDEASRTSVGHSMSERLSVPEHSLFEPFEETAVPHSFRRTIDSFVETFGTQSRFLVIPAEEREAALARIRAYLASRPETSGGEFDVPLLTKVVRATRR